MATLAEVRAIMESNDDAGHKLDRLAALLYPEPEEPVAPKPKARTVKPEPEPDAA